MNPVVAVVVKTVCGGMLVVAFAALAEALKPKRFAGILSAAPSVAIAGLVVGILEKGPTEQAISAHTMLAGAIGLIVCAAIAVPALRRFGPTKAMVLASAGWLITTGLAYPVIYPVLAT